MGHGLTDAFGPLLTSHFTNCCALNFMALVISTSDPFGLGSSALSAPWTRSGHGALSTAVHTLLLSTFLQSCPSEALYASGISANGWSWNWYMALTPYEAVFLNLIMLEIAVLRYLEILPININNLFYGDPSGRRKRRRRSDACAAAPKPLPDKVLDLCENSAQKQQISILDSLFAIMQKLDKQECLQRTLCQIEGSKISSCGSGIEGNSTIPETTEKIVTIIKNLVLPQTMANCAPNLVHLMDSLRRSIETGSKSALGDGGLTCGQAYSLCPIQNGDISYYLKQIYSG